MEQIMDALHDPALRKFLQAEAELDALEQRIFDISKRVEALRPARPNLKVRQAVKVGIVMQQRQSRARPATTRARQFDSRKRRTP